MSMQLFPPQITCAYLYPITLYGYPPDITHTVAHIREMAAMGFRSIELEGIGPANIDYLFNNQQQIKDTLAESGCELPVLCLVLPQLGSIDPAKRAESLSYFKKGCEVANALGAAGVLDNGPLLPFEYPENAPIQRHYNEELLNHLHLPKGFKWEKYERDLFETFGEACDIAAHYQLVYHMHPCEGSLITTADSFLNFANGVSRENLYFNMDTANQFYFRDNLPLSVLRAAEKISYIHISDNGGNRVEHLAAGDGEIAWNSFFEALQAVGFRGNFGLDIGGAETGIPDLKKAYLDSAVWLQDKLKKYSLNK
ncbi:sugar phosphate isomerase/epimerase [Terrimonas sp. NA20]|uniref:Sugar phosphate isomerase/epimerase n=1 Tax=Terrimonas ginsenosidimutans TaxID=2908004 RepID=A0ABS9KU58_9BACT|nr:sugar phosphate isomerase/epimerase family protein [Terrimonas ginsenosidimutans]MCG2615871.1 sugar phosphate isomerase/epimerase [Terrimonas ginsenosidimutans]